MQQDQGENVSTENCEGTSPGYNPNLEQSGLRDKSNCTEIIGESQTVRGEVEINLDTDTNPSDGEGSDNSPY